MKISITTFVLLCVVSGAMMFGCRPKYVNPNDHTLTPTVSETNKDGVYRLIRPEGPHNKETGEYSIALWSKDGVDTNKFVYMRSVLSNGESHYTRVSP